jgi:hypothetical protein
MIEDYDNDAKMAEAGRRSVKWKAINSAKEDIRNISVLIGNSTESNIIKDYQVDLNEYIDDLILALELE